MEPTGAEAVGTVEAVLVPVVPRAGLVGKRAPQQQEPAARLTLALAA